MLQIRNEIIQYLINRKKYSNYLEIGVDRGEVFFDINCKNKYAVDPEFKFDAVKKITRYLAKFPNIISNLNANYFPKTSDDFFAADARQIFKKNLDICFIDGMHEFDFALNDVLNSLEHLQDNGIIIMHDCNPQSKEEECSFRAWKDRGFTGGWNGDVWKTIVYLKTFHKDLTSFVVDTDQGLGIIMKSKPESNNYLFDFKTKEEIRNLDYDFLNKNRKELLGLMKVEDFNKRIGA